jgi:hypothetical protein
VIRRISVFTPKIYTESACCATLTASFFEAF